MSCDREPSAQKRACLTPAEREMLSQALLPATRAEPNQLTAAVFHLQSIFSPALRALDRYGYELPLTRNRVLRALVRGALQIDRAPADWTIKDWSEVRTSIAGLEGLALTVVAVQGYEVRSEDQYHPLFRLCSGVPLARRLFGRSILESEQARLRGAMARLGYSDKGVAYSLPCCVAELLIWHGSPTLDAATDDSVACFAENPPSTTVRKVLFGVSAGLVELGILKRRVGHGAARRITYAQPPGVPTEWLDWCRRWKSASTASPSTRASMHTALIVAGRWLALHQPGIVSPTHWTIETAHDWVRHVTERHAGDGVPPGRYVHHAGQPLAATGKAKLIAATRILFRDLLDWEWIERRFNPYRAFRLPKQIQRALGPKPRPIDDSFWFKLRTAALTLAADDLPNGGKGRKHLISPTMMRAVAVAWAFSGCRSDEITRLNLDCIYIEDIPEQIDAATGEVMPAFQQAMLRVPTNKTQGEFVKPVEAPLAEAIRHWQRERPHQPKLPDRITLQPTEYLFSIRGHMLGRGFINKAIIPLLLKKAGLPAHDGRGVITSHRARSTLATKLYSPSSGMAAIEVMKWLGHKDTSTGRYYVELTPVRLMTAFHKSLKLAENLRLVGVLADTGAGPGEPVLRYDLGHGWCTNPAYAMCAHRMACARCSFYEPAEAMRKRLEQQENRYVRVLQELRLADDERAAVTGDAEAVRQLIVRLRDVPTPDV